MVDFQLLEENFYLTLHANDNTVLTIPALDLLKPDRMEELIDAYGALIKARERSTTAAFFMSWYAGVCGAMQHMLYRNYTQLLDLSLSNLTVQLCTGEHYPFFLFKIEEVALIKPLDKDRMEERKQLLDCFYREQVTPIIQTLSQVANIHLIPLWGQIMNALYPQLQEELSEASDEAGRTRINEWFQLLTYGMEASAFGLRKNPFAIKRTYIEHLMIPEQKVFMKAACCLAYCLDHEMGYCYECPRLKEEDRAARRENERNQLQKET
ncbi:hypothetical protein [Paenibacillus sp. NPDC058071]|uniref:hypothetical protein n=1 Tax=Paenibacillus sp. NPDC058071 TaxID=3346326 RepID=UPI0036DB59CB